MAKTVPLHVRTACCLSSIDGHLGCMHRSPVVINAVVNFTVQVSVQVLYLFRELELAEHIVILFLTFQETIILVLKAAALFYIPTSNV